MPKNSPSLLNVTLCFTFFIVFANGQMVDWNNTNFHNIIFNRKYNLSRYHVYPFDLLKKVDFQQLYENLTAASRQAEEDVDGPLTFDDDSNTTSTLDKIASMCGKFRNTEAGILGRECLDDLDFIVCSLFDFIRAIRSFIKGSCDILKNPNSVLECQNDLRASMKKNFWAVQLLDSFGKLTSGINMGNHQYLGRYRDCRNIVVERADRPFEAAYCRATFQIPMPPTAELISDQCHGIPLLNGIGDPLFFNRSCEPRREFARFKFGICAPSTCNTRNMTVLFRYRLPPLKDFCNTTVVCEVRHFNFLIDKKFILIIFLISCLWGVMLAGTIYDVFFYQVAVKKRINDHKYNFAKEVDTMQLDSYKSNGNNRKNGFYEYKRQTKAENFDELNCGLKMLLAFSVYSNGVKLLSIVDKPHEFRCVNAIKTLSTFWMISIFAHLYIIGYIDNTKVLPSFIRRFCFQWINNGSFVSDTFLLLSGFLMCYWFLKRDYSRSIKSPCVWLKFYFRRLIRIFPPYFALILMMLMIWKYFPRGPMWTNYFFATNSPLQCSYSFWTNFLFLNNFLYMGSACMPTTQLIALDMQIYIIAPLLFLLYLKVPKIGFVVSAVLIGLSVILQTVLAVFKNLPPSMIATVDVYSLDTPMTDYYNILFIKPYMRWNAFVVGMMLAHFIVQIQEGTIVHIGKKYTVLLWFIAITLCTSVVYGLVGYARGSPMPTFVLAIYTCLSRLVWSLSVAAIMFLCITNRGGIFQWMFSWPFWAPLSRLTYSIYLICPFVIAYTYTSSHASLHLTAFNMIYFTVGIIILNYMIAVIFHLTFEAPWLAFRNMFCFKSMLECSEDVNLRSRNNEKFEVPSGRIIEENRLLPSAVIIDGAVEMLPAKTKL